MSLDLTSLKVGDRVEVPGLHNTDPMDVVFVGTYMAVGRRDDGTECLLNLGARSLVPPPPLIDPEQVWWTSGGGGRTIFKCASGALGPDCGPYRHFRITATERVE